jgi:hypothetical protein
VSIRADDVIELLPGLAGERPVFHSEADFQQALAWAIHVAHPGLRVRLETRPVRGTHLDLLVTDPTDGGSLAIELKYLTDKWEGEVDGEQFALLRQSAQDIRGYDCVKDIARVEKLMAAGYAKAGLVLVLANDPSYWRTPTHDRGTNADAFRLHDGLILTGAHVWGPRTGPGTSASRTNPIDLAGVYTLAWRDFSELPGTRGRFRYLAVPVE